MLYKIVFDESGLLFEWMYPISHQVRFDLKLFYN